MTVKLQTAVLLFFLCSVLGWGIVRPTDTQGDWVRFKTPYSFNLNTLTDVTFMSVGAGLTILGSFILPYALPKREITLADLDPARVNILDRALSPFRGNAPLSVAETVLMYVGNSFPLVVSTIAHIAGGYGPSDTFKRFLVDLVMYSEVMLITYGFKELNKSLFFRIRPYAYDASTGLYQKSVSARSFLSGPAALTFSAAGFLTTLTAIDLGNHWLTYLAGISSFAIAFTTGALGILNGDHFFTDVLAGAVGGTLIGWLVPYIHRRTGGKAKENTLTPDPNAPRVSLNLSSGIGLKIDIPLL